MSNTPKLVSVIKVLPLEGLVLKVWFDDGTEREVDVGELMRGPVFEEIRDNPELFRQVSIQGGTVVWPNDADIDPVVLHGSATPAWKEDGETSRAG